MKSEGQTNRMDVNKLELNISTIFLPSDILSVSDSAADHIRFEFQKPSQAVNRNKLTMNLLSVMMTH